MTTTTSTAPTPGFNRRMQFAFTSDKRGRPIAYYYGGHSFGRCWFRTPYEAAKVLVAQELADETPYVRDPMGVK